ncbi:MAG: ferrous iron transporter B [Waddliaceae bacterium]|nr:ferrous iron transporter B [Waddliaceae bacterium]
MTACMTEQKATEVLLIGPPNVGKTTLFNTLTGSDLKVVNYPGATTVYYTGKCLGTWNLDATCIDTPGMVSLNPSSPDQEVALKQLEESKQKGSVIVVVVDATQLSRHLYLVEQLKEAGYSIVVAVTMIDLLEKRGAAICCKTLSQLQESPCVLVDPRKAIEVEYLINAIKQHDPSVPTQENITLKDLNKDPICSRFEKITRIESEALQNCPRQEQSQQKWDCWLLHPVWGLVIFLLTMSFFFSSIFVVAQPIMDAIDDGFASLISLVNEIGPDSWYTNLFTEGLLAGIGAALVFTPQIFILFFLMGCFEATGYLARGAALIDRPLSAIGLNGKAFVPLMSGFACAIPATMATRTISNPRERWLTIFILPLMSCSARLPVYALLLAFLVPSKQPWIGGLAMTALYLTGILSATIIATVISKFQSKSMQQTSLLLELPALRRPQFAHVWRSALRSTSNYIRNAGMVIIAISMLLWSLTHLPMSDSDSEYSTVSQSYAAKAGQVLEPLMEPMGLDWRSGVSIMMGFAAREVFVGSMALMYRIDDGDSDIDQVQGKLLQNMHKITFENSDRPIFTVSSVIGLLFFFTMALQCFPTMVVARKELGSWTTPIIQWLLFTGLGYVGAVGIVQGLRLIGVS